MTEKKYKPILFNTEMVQAILSGKKTQTRRILTPQPYEVECYDMSETYPSELIRIAEKKDCYTILRHPKKGRYDGIHKGDAPKLWPAKYQVGDIFWVRETWQTSYNYENDNWDYIYKSDGGYWIDDDGPMKWKPSIHMPKAAARIFLRITKVRVERLKYISEEDAIAEGVKFYWYDELRNIKLESAKSVFRNLWKDLYGEDSYKQNPFVFVYEFELIDKALDF